MIMMEPTRSRSAAHPRHAADDDRERPLPVGADGDDDGDRQRNLGQQRCRTEAPPATASVGLRLWAAVFLALYVAFWLELDNAHGAGTSAAIVC